VAEHVDAADGRLNDSSLVVDDPPADEHRKHEGTDDHVETRVRRLYLPTLQALVVGVFVVMGLAALVGWLGYRTYEDRQAQAQRNLFLQVGRQGAVNLTTISYTEVDADVQRIVDSATGSFRDDFQQRSGPFIAAVKQAQSKSQNGDRAQVLVAVSVRTSNAGAPQPDPRAWRMRISVAKVGDTGKVSDVQFVP
jgi:Mce-associated membrane protein